MRKFFLFTGAIIVFINALAVILNYKVGNFKMAILCAFACGFVISAIIELIISAIIELIITNRKN